MEIIVSVLGTLKSPKLSLVILLFCLTVLFFPYDWAGISRPEFVSNYESVVTSLMFLSAAVLTVEIIQLVGSMLFAPVRALRRNRYYRNMLNSLNLDELCVVYAMVKSGTRVIKGPATGHILTSLREKGALRLMAGLQSFHETSHSMPEELEAIVFFEGEKRFPQEFFSSPRFEDEVRERLDRAVNWRRN